MELQRSLFESREGEAFQIHDIGDHNISLTLKEVRTQEERILQRARELGIREPFDLMFQGPKEPFLPQHMYTLQHEELGRFELFLVPVNQDGKGFYYEAVFG